MSAKQWHRKRKLERMEQDFRELHGERYGHMDADYKPVISDRSGFEKERRRYMRRLWWKRLPARIRSWFRRLFRRRPRR